jgi:acyl-CoA synthetase (AMP-forming)/AMP-acid ligase II/lauroyl/myristoyl acyltransferase
MTITFAKPEIENSVGARLRKLAEYLPRAEAVRFGPDSISFSELDSLSDRIARYLVAVRGPAPEPVAVLLEQGIHSLAATLGILKAGKSFSIFPPYFSQDRLGAIWRDLQHPPIFSKSALRGISTSLCGDPKSILEFETASAAEGSPDLPAVTPDTIGAIFYTSASTGEPKGVMCPQRMILHTAWQNGDLYRIRPGDRLTHLSAYGFGAATTASLAAIFNGAALDLPAENAISLKHLLAFLRAHRISILSLTSFGLFRQVNPRVKRPKAALPDLRLVLLGGEDLYHPDLEIFRELFPQQTSLSYRLAGSEAMLMRENRIEFRTPLPNGKLPVGRAVPDKELLLLDEQRLPVPAGQVGEIAIRTRYLASGYWQKEERYNTSFQPDPSRPDLKIYFSGDLGRLDPDGQLEYLGRKDNIVKIRGFSLRLEDVERGLQMIGGINECCATALVLPSGDKRLAAYIVWAPGAARPVEEIRGELAELLPRFMIPTVFVFPDSLPRTATGKVARAELPPPSTIRPPLQTPLVLPVSDVEKKLCALWADLLHIDTVGIHDNFFDLGGDSLLALHLSFRIESEWNRQIPPGFFSQPTVSSLAALWQNNTPPAPAAAIPGRKAARRYQKRNRERRTRLSAPIFYGKPRIRHRERNLRDPSLLFRGLVAAAAVQFPYSPGSRWAGWAVSQPFAQRYFLHRHIVLYRQFLRDLGGAPDAPQGALEIFLAGTILWSRMARRGIKHSSGRHFVEQMRKASSRYWRDVAGLIEHGSDDAFRRFFHVTGLEYIEEALRAQKGVIIATYHNTANRLAMAALPRRLHCDPIPTISIMRALYLEKKRMREVRENFVPATEDTLIADLTLEGKNLLDEGKIIQIVPDNTSDTVGNRPLTIGGRRFQIKSGLAEYALLTGAAIVPQYSTRRLDGSIRMTIQPPIEIPSAALDREDRIYTIMKQYAAFVDRSLRLAPEGINWSTMHRVLDKPRAPRSPAPGAESGGRSSDPSRENGD